MERDVFMLATKAQAYDLIDLVVVKSLKMEFVPNIYDMVPYFDMVLYH